MRKTYLLLLILLFLSGNYDSLAQDLSKYHALFISKFIDYIEWPDDGKLTIGVVGNSRVLIELQNTVEKRGEARLKKVAGMEGVEDCDIIFIPSSQNKLFSRLKDATSGQNVLIITEDESLAARGAGVSFYTEGGKLKFIINQSVVASQQLKVSKSLLVLARVIN